MLKRLLYSDLQRQTSLEGGTAAPSGFQLLRRLLHPRFLPIVLCRLSRGAWLAGIPGLPSLLTYFNITLFGLEVSPRCEIGPGIFFPHSSGTVIGAWRIGSNVTIFQGVTLGSKELDMGFNQWLRPEVGNNVILGAGCKVLGGIHLGDNVTVGANSVVLESVEAASTVVGIPARTVSKSKSRQATAAASRLGE
jgi:serine O-acetyltransferase